MPMAIPLIAAYASVSAGVAAMGGMAAIAAGTVSLGAGLIGGMMIAGGAMTAMGALTHDKTLSKWGGVLSLAGGVAGLANGAWSNAANDVAMGSGADAADALAPEFTSANPAADVGNVAPNAAPDAAAQAVDSAQTAMTPMAPVDSLADNVSAGPQFNTPPLDVPTLDAPPGSVPDANALAQPGLTPPTGQPMPPSATAPAPAVPSTAPPAPAAPTAPGVTAPPAPVATSTDGGLLQSVKDGFKWASKSDANARIAQTGAGVVGMIGKYYGDQDTVKTQIALQEAAAQRARDRLNASVKGVTVPTYQPRKA